jgi:hypothetical protein
LIVKAAAIATAIRVRIVVLSPLRELAIRTVIAGFFNAPLPRKAEDRNGPHARSTTLKVYSRDIVLTAIAAQDKLISERP